MTNTDVTAMTPCMKNLTH